MKYDNVNIHDLIKIQSESFKLLIEERKGEFVIEFIDSINCVNIDAFHMANVINNLLDNACKYSPDRPNVRIATYVKNNRFCIAISDKGLGIDKANRKIIFQEFSRVNTGNVHNVKGFGLGLSYVLQIIEMHNGELKLESEIGQGSTFIIQLPIN